MIKTTCVLKMLGDKAHESRQICEYPKPYKDKATPCSKLDFSESTKKICLDDFEMLMSALKISKLIILGDVSVGKTCIVNRFCYQTYETGYKATIGVDFQVERFDVLNVPFHLQIWDTAGQERFKCISQCYYRSSHGIVLVFDFTQIITLSNCRNWLRDALNAAGNKNPLIFLVGTKKDLVSQATFENIESSAINVAKKLNAEYWAVSSKTNENIKELFFRIAALTFDDSFTKEIESVAINIESDLVSFKKNEGTNPRKSNHSCVANNCKNV